MGQAWVNAVPRYPEFDSLTMAAYVGPTGAI